MPPWWEREWSPSATGCTSRSYRPDLQERRGAGRHPTCCAPRPVFATPLRQQMERDLGRRGVGLGDDPHVIDLPSVLEVEQRVDARGVDPVGEVHHLRFAVIEDDL